MTIAYACVCVCKCRVNFGDEIPLRREECKTREKKFNFSEYGKTVILVGNRKNFRSRMTKRTSLLNSSREI